MEAYRLEVTSAPMYRLEKGVPSSGWTYLGPSLHIVTLVVTCSEFACF
jgi:hypothetical protein